MTTTDVTIPALVDLAKTLAEQLPPNRREPYVEAQDADALRRAYADPSIRKVFEEYDARVHEAADAIAEAAGNDLDLIDAARPPEPEVGYEPMWASLLTLARIKVYKMHEPLDERARFTARAAFCEAGRLIPTTWGRFQRDELEACHGPAGNDASKAHPRAPGRS